MTDSQKLDALTTEVALLKSGLRQQLVLSNKLILLVHVLLEKAGADKTRIHDLLSREHAGVDYIVAKELGFDPPVPSSW